jgi:phosphoribosylanthranilate isomerase
MIWLKICGITRLPDAELVESLGADALGFIFAPSPRRISLETASHIVARLNTISRVGVFVNAPLQQVEHVRKTCALDLVQLHGDESPEYCRKLGGSIIKALRPRHAADLSAIDQYPMVWKILLDAYVENQRGGTGQSLNVEWTVVDPSRIIAAGGVGPDNALALLQTVRPFGLDCSSRLETAPGIKDSQKIREMITLVKQTKR